MPAVTPCAYHAGLLLLAWFAFTLNSLCCWPSSRNATTTVAYVVPLALARVRRWHACRAALYALALRMNWIPGFYTMPLYAAYGPRPGFPGCCGPTYSPTFPVYLIPHHICCDPQFYNWLVTVPGYTTVGLYHVVGDYICPFRFSQYVGDLHTRLLILPPRLILRLALRC